jgi:hypothetical protein
MYKKKTETWTFKHLLINITSSLILYLPSTSLERIKESLGNMLLLPFLVFFRARKCFLKAKAKTTK